LAFLVRLKKRHFDGHGGHGAQGPPCVCSTSQVGHLIDYEDAAVGMLLLTRHGCGMMEMATANGLCELILSER
jgi:hypothetical protein